ncbi:MAG: LysR substrate-binding domain-containing protein [Peptococcaceae bacterium]|nr:LysR substrate-binding domain-containing protein [Peptococcaceae bacterium]
MLLDPLKIFLTVAEEKSFSRAADELYLSQPGVSSQIRNLENELGTRLISRSSKHVELTPSGEIMYRYAQDLLRLYNLAVEDINRIRNVVSGTLKIGASFTIGEYILPKVLAQTTAKYPNLDIVVTIANTEEIFQNLRAHHLDVGVVEGQVDTSGLTCEEFMDDEMILIMPQGHALAKIPKITVQDLQDCVWIMREPGSGTRAFSNTLIKQLGLRVKRAYVFSSNEGVKEAVSNGLGIAVVSRLIVQRELNAGDMLSRPINSKKVYLHRKFIILRHKEPFGSHAMEVFLEELKS